MRMYTSYSGMRSTGGATAPSLKTFRGCVFAGTPSLCTLMQLHVRVVIRESPAPLLLGEPGVEARRDEPVRALLLLRRAYRERVGVLVLRVPGVPAHPAPL